MQPRRAISPAPSPAMRAAAAPSPCRAARPTGAPARSASRRSDRSRRTRRATIRSATRARRADALDDERVAVSAQPRKQLASHPERRRTVRHALLDAAPRKRDPADIVECHGSSWGASPESRSATVPENRASRPFARLFARRANALRHTPAAATNAIANACAGRRMPPGVAGAPPAQGEDDGEATGSSMRGTTRARRRRCRARASRCPSARLPMRRPRRYGTARTPAIR